MDIPMPFATTLPEDLDCRLYSTPNDVATSRNLSGGWHDAGDYNKYVNFNVDALVNLLFAYSEFANLDRRPQYPPNGQWHARYFRRNKIRIGLACAYAAEQWRYISVAVPKTTQQAAHPLPMLLAACTAGHHVCLVHCSSGICLRRYTI